MIWGVFQHLRIVTTTPGRLVLRELPLLEWLMAFAVMLLGFNFIIMNMTITAVGAFLVALVIVMSSRSRILIFDAADRELRILFQYPLRQRVVNQIPLAQIDRAYLSKDDNDSTQIILVTQRGDMGLSVYSRDNRPWKEDICKAINDFLRSQS
ncbi:hypothetical protein G4Y79_22535 [Phototrophicus methaneseepsis]|uniref:Uncharacterized protein n=1 Tax=Phototrophicus methaneseepsis TaxID=2710758 RepID=A0A7S8E8X7_9CHLR|nr:hypothetical protein [Phototrophicus methaneseepsis]QPC82429.1 hypothetical protein G4Y79_22535 [Phototrophicus methaneseepsis]